MASLPSFPTLMIKCVPGDDGNHVVILAEIWTESAPCREKAVADLTATLRSSTGAESSAFDYAVGQPWSSFSGMRMAFQPWRPCEMVE
jgi:hypothetical protein